MCQQKSQFSPDFPSVHAAAIRRISGGFCLSVKLRLIFRSQICQLWLVSLDSSQGLKPHNQGWDQPLGFPEFNKPVVGPLYRHYGKDTGISLVSHGLHTRRSQGGKIIAALLRWAAPGAGGPCDQVTMVIHCSGRAGPPWGPES